MIRQEDPVYRNARREALVIAAVWLTALVTCCTVCYVLGYSRPGHELGPEDLHPVVGIPAWVFWGFLVPWLVSGIFTVWYAGFVIAEDDLGRDHAAELEADIHEAGELRHHG